MARPASSHSTDLELEILKILWKTGPAPVRSVRDALAAAGRELAYTSVMTIMTIMTRKGYLRRKKADGLFIYRPSITEHSTTRGMLQDLVNRAFDGSAAALVQRLLETSDIDDAELQTLRELIRRKQKGEQP
jgi:BlaI family transcriptional regulator, penicillinase repressor